MNPYKTIILIMFSLLFTFCSDDKAKTEIIIKNGNAEIINGDTIIVNLNSVHQTLVHVSYERGSVRYLRQIDEGSIDLLKNQVDYEKISHGIEEDGNNFEKVVITTEYSDSLIQPGSHVKISVQINTEFVEWVCYKVED